MSYKLHNQIIYGLMNFTFVYIIVLWMWSFVWMEIICTYAQAHAILKHMIEMCDVFNIICVIQLIYVLATKHIAAPADFKWCLPAYTVYF